VLEAHAVRDRLSTTASLLTNRLGEHDRGPVTNVEAARTSLTAVRHLQSALGDRLNPERLARLLAADAFKNDAVLDPARNLGPALAAWSADVAKLGGAPAVAMNGIELGQWASLVEAALPVVEKAVIAADGPGRSATTLRDLVYDLLVRERYDELTVDAPRSVVTGADSGAAS
jgi:hypothetical protein